MPEAPPRRPTALEPWSSAALHILGWLPAAAMCFYAKHRLLQMHGYRLTATSMGRSGASELSSDERLSFFQEDALILLVVTPWLLLVALRYLRPWTRSILSAFVGVSVFLIIFLQLRTFNELGHFSTYPVMGELLSGLREHPEMLDRMLDPRTILKIGLPCTTILFLAWAAGQFDPRRNTSIRWQAWGRRLGRAMLLVLMPLFLVGATLSFDQALPPTPYHDSVLLRVLATLHGPTPVDTADYERLSDPEMHSVYRDLSRTPDPRLFPDMYGAAAGQDVIFFVLPTMPADRLDFSDELEDMPALAFLSSVRSWPRGTTRPTPPRAAPSSHSTAGSTQGACRRTCTKTSRAGDCRRCPGWPRSAATRRRSSARSRGDPSSVSAGIAPWASSRSSARGRTGTPATRAR